MRREASQRGEREEHALMFNLRLQTCAVRAGPERASRFPGRGEAHAGVHVLLSNGRSTLLSTKSVCGGIRAELEPSGSMHSMPPFMTTPNRWGNDQRRKTGMVCNPHSCTTDRR